MHPRHRAARMIGIIAAILGAAALVVVLLLQDDCPPGDHSDTCVGCTDDCLAPAPSLTVPPTKE